MTADLAASSLAGTSDVLPDVPLPVILVGYSIAGLTTRLYVGEHPADVAGVVLFDPQWPRSPACSTRGSSVPTGTER